MSSDYLFKTKTATEHTTSLASFMPGGRPFLAAKIEGSTLRKMLAGLALELAREDTTLNDITYEHDISQTTQLIEQWESALGIPDDCFNNTGTLLERRRNVIIKLSSSLQTAQDFIDLAAVLGFVIQIKTGSERGIFPFNNTFPIYFFDTPQSARFTEIFFVYTVSLPNVFPLDFPINFNGNATDLLKCLFTCMSPANVLVIFNFLLPDEGAIITENLRNYFYLQDGSGFIVTQ